MSSFKVDKERQEIYRAFMPGFFGDCWRYHLADSECNNAKNDVKDINPVIRRTENYIAQQKKGIPVDVLPTGYSHADDLRILKSRLLQAEARLENTEKQRLLCLKKYEFARPFDSRNDIGLRIAAVATTPIALAIWTLDTLVTAVYHLIWALYQLASSNLEDTHHVDLFPQLLLFSVVLAIAASVSLVVETLHLVLAPILPNFDKEVEAVTTEVTEEETMTAEVTDLACHI